MVNKDKTAAVPLKERPNCWLAVAVVIMTRRLTGLEGGSDAGLGVGAVDSGAGAGAGDGSVGGAPVGETSGAGGEESAGGGDGAWGAGAGAS